MKIERLVLVVDASVAVKFVVREPGTDEARELLRSDDLLVAPDWILPEVASALWNKVRRSELLIVQAERCLQAIPAFFAQLFGSAELSAAAFGLAFRLRHPVYDCLYLALAMREGMPIVTADRKFHRIMADTGLVDARLLVTEA